jgi:heptosyltransferase III
MSEEAVNPESIRRVLVVKLRHHGDVLLSSPVFRVLKAHLPQIETDALVYHDTREMLSGHPSVSQVHTIDRDWKHQGIIRQTRAEWRLLAQLRSRRYDMLLHLTEHPRGAWLTRLLHPQISVAPRATGMSEGRNSNWWRASFTHTFPLPKTTFRHTVEQNLDALRRLGIHPTMEEKKLVLVPGIEAEQKIDALMAAHGVEAKRFIHMHPTSRWFFKTWPADKFAELILRLGKQGERVVLTAAPTFEERNMIAAIKTHLKAPIVDLTGELNLKELAALTARAKAFVGVDSAPMHIAAAMQTPTVALFGPSGEKHWGPWGVKFRVVASVKPEHSCRPCGNDGCGGSKVSDCLMTLSVDDVHAAVNEILAKA